MNDAPSKQNPPTLEVRNLVKKFPGAVALGGVSMWHREGEVLAVIGENGAGKSTLMKILAGVQEPDGGELLMNGNVVRIPNPKSATDLGIALIHQELNLADNLDIASNIFLGREPHGKFGWIHQREIRERAAVALDQVGLKESVRTLVRDLSIGRQQMVEIAKALSFDARIIIMDEPTSSLSQYETENLFQLIHTLRDRGVGIIYISHRLGEVKELADRVVALRDGQNAGELSREEINSDRMIQMMVGREFSQFYQREDRPLGDVALEVKDLKTPSFPKHALNFKIRSGEVVGLAGLVGAGRTELLRCLFGIEPAVSGTILVNGLEATPKTPIEAIESGISLAPEDRKHHGLILEMTVGENLSLPSLKRDQNHGFLNREKERSLIDRMIHSMGVKTQSHKQIIQYLSGGNQQKVVLGKWLGMEPRILLMDEPTRGIDVGAKQEIYRLMEILASEGVAILYASSEMEEILGMADRALVMHEGQITGELLREDMSEEAIMQLATGQQVEAEAKSRTE